MTANPPGAVEQRVRDFMRAEQIRQEIPLAVRRRKHRLGWACVRIARLVRQAGGGHGRR